MAGPISPDKLGLFVVSTAEGTDGKVLASKFRQLRLETLKGDPNSWLSNYDAEVELPIEHWLAHLQHPLRTVFVCVRKTSSSAESESPSLLNDEWIGVVELIGPYPAAKWHWPQASPLHTDEEELRYHATGAFVKKDHRKSQPPIFARLSFLYNDWTVQQARKLLHQHRIDGKPITKIFCRQRNALAPGAIKLRAFYEHLGITPYGFITPAEEFLANEVTVPLPERTEENRAFFEEKSMATFEKLVEITESTVWPEGVALSQGPWLGPLEERVRSESRDPGERRTGIPIRDIAKVAKL